MVEDIVRAYGFLPLGSRLRRIGERLQADTQRVMDEMDVPLQAGQYPFLGALDRLGPLTVGELAEAVGITQPGATRCVAELVKLGMVGVRQAGDDQRRKIVSLTSKGAQQVDFAKREVWPSPGGGSEADASVAPSASDDKDIGRSSGPPKHRRTRAYLAASGAAIALGLVFGFLPLRHRAPDFLRHPFPTGVRLFVPPPNPGAVDQIAVLAK